MHSVQWDEIHIVPYGTSKLGFSHGSDILFDDAKHNRIEWEEKEDNTAYYVDAILDVLKGLDACHKKQTETKEEAPQENEKFLVVDTETANGLEDCLMYDCGFAVVDATGKVYETGSYINKDIFLHEWKLMESAYYAEKIPQYLEELAQGKRILKSEYEISAIVREVIKKYGIKAVCAHNARFDVRALNKTKRYITKSKFRYFLPYGVEIWDTMRMAQDVICKDPDYIDFCKKNGHICANGQVRKSAEVLYKYISGNNDFTEAHTGLEDVMIEKEILAYCLAKNPNCKRKLW